jgi:hypothetical protein
MEYGEPGVSTLSPAPPPCCQLSQFHQVLHELVSMDNVEGGVGESQLVDVPEEQAEIPHTLRGGHGLGCRDRRWCGIDADHPALREPSGQIDGNSPGTDANVQQPVCCVQLRQ